MTLGIKWPLVSRALARHEPQTVYTLLREGLAPGLSDRALEALVLTVPGWPNGQRTSQICDQPDSLKPYELDVLRCAARGMNVRDTARRLRVAESTVKAYRKQTSAKLDAHSIGEAVAIANQKGLI
jgi:DNA-binding CsgD family transcriptional regulator